ncbi:MAG: carbonic anhydrase [Patescibacteria group bacterium]
MRKLLAILFGLCLFFGISYSAEPIGKAVLADLLLANKAQRDGNLKEKYQTVGPVAVVLYCSEPGEDPYAIFNQDKDQLAVVRTAGNTISIPGTFADSVEIGSIEYPVHYQGTPLVVVVGHTDCAVVDTVLGFAETDTGGPAGNMNNVFHVIRPSVTLAMKAKESHEDRFHEAVVNHVKNMVYRLKKSNYLLGKKVQAGELVIVGCLYDAEQGTVEVVDMK